MLDENTYFYNESDDDTDFIDSQLESFDEFAESVMAEAAINHMTASEKLQAKKYRNSAAGKKAIAKHLKKASKAGYRVDKALSKKMKKVAALRNEDFDFEDEEMCEAFLNTIDPEVLASVDSIVEDLINFSEACKDEDDAPLVDPETGEELDEMKHMTAAAKLKAKKYRNSAAGKKAIAKHLKKASRAGYRVDKALSKKMKKVAAFRNEDIDMDESEFDALSELMLDVLMNSDEIYEACRDEDCDIEDCKETDDSCEIEITHDDESEVQKAAADNSVRIVSSDEDTYVVKGSCDDLEDFLDDLGIDDDVENLLTNSSCNEAIKHMSAAAKLAAKKYRNSAAGRKALKKYLKKRSRAGYRVDKALSKKMKKVAAQRREAIEETLDEQFASFNSLFGSLNESETAELKTIVQNTFSTLLESSEKAIYEDLTTAYENYVNEELMPEIFDTFDNQYIKIIMQEHNDQIDEWLSEAAEEVVNDLDSRKLIVKSHAAVQNEEFVEDLLDLIQDKLKILPEQEEYIDTTNEQIDSLNKRLQESSIENIKLRDKLNEAKRFEYAYKNIPSDIFESDREKLLDYVENELSEADSYEDFVNYFDDAVNTIRSNNNTSYNNIDEDYDYYESNRNKNQQSSSLMDSILRISK